MSAASGKAVLLCADLLFGSKVEALVAEAGLTCVTCTTPAACEPLLADAELLIVDLSDESFDACVNLRTWSDGALLGEAITLGYYQHVDDATRVAALAAGFDQVVPRSRLFR
ncbi:MAG: hypothetical protein JHC87_08895, partial [Thermoleophilaceae bacterium]|nr:hypothetical protein [Thermoleophilaceae bacterium]